MDKPKIYKYGYDVNELDQRLYSPQQIKTDWGYFSKLTEENNYYVLEQVFIKERMVYPRRVENYQNQEAVIYLESGSVVVKLRDKENNEYLNELIPQETILLPAKTPYEFFEIASQKDSFVYIFSGPPLIKDSRESTFQKSKTFDLRHKDWAETKIQTIVNRAYTGKKIFFKKGNSSSLHFHCQKIETYFVHSGRLFLRFRAGQGEDRFFVVNSGQSIHISPGLMHQVGALEDLTIIEVSTHDEDSDSFIVESEFVEMPRLKKY